ncbi:putative Prefoldin subunit [Hibiscus syriacus]|uniref:Prefoldin subunit n=1 Tax=Hibiscus syriacus TaxID=106335 RepID=A0A6A2ZXA8_HIBSY|nr:putative Prefoldin subunit [Hibiscus syriacus]
MVNYFVGLVANGDFETRPSNGFPSDSISDGPTEIPSWSTKGMVELVSAGEKVSGGVLLIVPRGTHAVRLGNDAEISQEVQVEKGSTYAITFSAARTCAQLESLNVSVPPASRTVDLQTLYNVQGWDPYSISFEAEEDKARLVFRNPGMEDDPECGPIIDDIAIKKLVTPDTPKDNAVVNAGFEFGPWMFQNVSLGVLLPTNLDEETSRYLDGWSNRTERFDTLTPITMRCQKENVPSSHARDKCKEPLAVMAFAGDQAQSFHYTPDSNSTFQVANVNFTAKAERTRIAFYSVYYNTRTDDMSSLCGPVVDDVRVWFSGSGRIEARILLGLGLAFWAYLLVLV